MEGFKGLGFHVRLVAGFCNAIPNLRVLPTERELETFWASCHCWGSGGFYYTTIVLYYCTTMSYHIVLYYIMFYFYIFVHYTTLHYISQCSVVPSLKQSLQNP